MKTSCERESSDSNINQLSLVANKCQSDSSAFHQGILLYIPSFSSPKVERRDCCALPAVLLGHKFVTIRKYTRTDGTKK